MLQMGPRRISSRIEVFFSVLILSMLANAHGLAIETMRVYLSGRGKDDAVEWRFLCTHGARSGSWTTIPVPSNWEMYGFGSLSYKKDPTNAWDECGIYEREFWVPPEWQGKRVFIVFEGAMTDTEVSINGKLAGPPHRGGFYRFKYEITSLLTFGETNTVQVKVWKHSRNKSVNRAERMADYWVFGGIYRPVYLEILPPQFIERVAIDAKHDGRFLIEVYTVGITKADDEMKVVVEVRDKTGARVGHAISADISHDNKAVLITRFNGIKAWSAETPELYHAVISLFHGSHELHRHMERFGFRTVEVINGDGIYVNKKRITLKGVNRHSFWPDSGRCLSENVHRLDIELIKGMNMNAVRCSHYPPDKEFLDLCDELGLYVLNELAGWHNSYDTEIGRELVRAMVTRDVNHPCVLFWNNGNEGGWNTALDTEFYRYDPQKRLVLHPWSPFNGINTAHYLAYENAVLACKGLPVYFRNNEESVDPSDTDLYIYMPTEFLHGLYDGGAGAGLEDYWKLMKSSKLCAGGFIWAYLDEGVRRPDTGEIDTAGNQAPDGIVGPYRQKEASYFTIREIFCPIQLTYNPPDTLEVENEFDFIDASECKLEWQLVKFPHPWEEPEEIILATGTIKPPAIAPGKKGTIKLPVNNLPMAEADALKIKVDDPYGREIICRVWLLRSENPTAKLLARNTRSMTSSAPIFSNASETVSVIVGQVELEWSKETGYLVSTKVNGKPIHFRNGPRPATQAPKLTSLTLTNVENAILIQAYYTGGLEKVSWTVYPFGWIRCDFAYTAKGLLPYFGVLFDLDEKSVTGKRWVGLGPYRVWKNRMRGVSYGYWTNGYNNTVTGMSEWIYPEFKGCFADVRWLQLIMRHGRITFVFEDIPFVQVLTPCQPPPELAGFARADLPQCGLGLLHGIPPIGSKFKHPETTGPQGQLNVASGTYKGSFWFRLEE